jgi:hypothetical protein
MTTDRPPTWISLSDARKQIVGDASDARKQIVGDAAWATLLQDPPPQMQYPGPFFAQAAVDREFCDRMATGIWQSVGRRGSPTAPQSDIPAVAWLHLRVTDWQRSTVAEPDGTVWYDVRVFPAGTESAATPAAPPTVTAQRKKLTPKGWLTKAVQDHPRRQNELPMEYASRLHERMKAAARANPGLKVMKPKSIANRLAEMKKESAARRR